MPVDPAAVKELDEVREQHSAQVARLASENQKLRVQVTELEGLASRYQQAGQQEYRSASAAEQELLRANEGHRWAGAGGAA